MDEHLYGKAALIRQFEERLLSLFAEGRLSGTVHTCIGQEMSAVAVGEALRGGDWVFSNHRCHGHYLARFDDVRGLLAEIMGAPEGICAGRGGSQHVYRDQFLSNGVQGGGVPIAAGCALALTRMPGNQSIAVAFIGDGTLGQGVLYETLNLAAKLPVPLLIVLEHNRYAQSTSTETTIAGEIRGRFEAFGWRFFEGAIWDEGELLTQARQAADHVRETRSPAVLRVECYRLKAHSKGDDNRDPAEIAAYLERDPMQVFARANPAAAARIDQECQAKLAGALASIQVPPNGKTNGDSHALRAELSSRARTWAPLPAQPAQRVVERLNAGLKDLMARDERVLLIGEDVEDPYGGAFKVSRGLTRAYPGRVRNMPISEAAIAGLGNGLALAGLRPIVEIMFGDFITLAADQLINQASKFAYMYNHQVSVPVLVRTPMGGKRGYGATHSQSLEKHFFGTPGLHIAAVNAVFDPAALLQRLHDNLDGPCLLIENKMLYTTPTRTAAADGRVWLHDGQAFPTLLLPADGPADVTIVTYGGMLEEVEAAAKTAFIEHEISAEIVVPTLLFPLDADPIIESVGRTGRLLVVEEGQGFAGFGSEVIARCAEALRGRPFQAARVAASEHPIPCSRELEKHALPDAGQVLASVRQLALV